MFSLVEHKVGCCVCSFVCFRFCNFFNILSFCIVLFYSYSDSFCCIAPMLEFLGIISLGIFIDLNILSIFHSRHIFHIFHQFTGFASILFDRFLLILFYHLFFDPIDFTIFINFVGFFK